MSWTLGKATLPQATGTHTIPVPEGAKVMAATGLVTLDVIYMAPDGAAPEDRNFDVVLMGESLPEYDKKNQRFIGTVVIGDVLMAVFERLGAVE